MISARDNPFRMDRIERLPMQLQTTTISELLQRFAQHNYRGVLVGKHGSGKTTLRELLQHQLQKEWRVVCAKIDSGTTHVATDFTSHLARCDAQTIFVIDGIDRITSWTWWRHRRALARLGGVLATSHYGGRLPELHRHHTSPGLLRSLVEQLLHPNASPFTDHQLTTLWHANHGNIRLCLRQCYDWWSQHGQPLPEIAHQPILLSSAS